MIYLAISIIGLCLSFFFAGSETAFITTNKVRFAIWLKQRKKSAIAAKKYFNNPEIFLSTTLVGNNIANILASSYATVYLINYYSEAMSWAIITFTLLFFGEILPKIIFRTFAEILILKLIYLIRFFNFILNPVIRLANIVSTFVLKLFNIEKEVQHDLLDKSEIQSMVNIARISGLVDEEEEKIITNVLELPNKLVREAMIPRTAINAVEYAQGIAGIRKMIIKSGNTKIPVYKETIDNIIGVVFIFDLFQRPDSLEDLLTSVQFIPDNKRCNELLQEFKQTNTTIAIVIDEYGGTAGIVTVEDLMEELFGEIEESSSDDTVGIRALNRNTYRVKANETIENLYEQLDIEIPDGSYETLGGFIITELGHIPKAGEQLELENYRIIINKSDNKKIHDVRLIKKNFLRE